jgi:phosphoglycolate phosphatase-like HAD superfamily hydrolase
MTERPYDAVVFDNDGVIVEPTERARLVDAVQRTFREFGHEPPREVARRAVATAAGPRETVGDRDVHLDARLGLVSNNQAETVAFLVDYYGFDQFETVYGREPSLAGARRRKPEPYYLEQALADLGAQRALYVGDSQKDVRAAHRAGIDSAFLRREHRADADLDVEPTYDLQDLHALVETVRVEP